MPTYDYQCQACGHEFEEFQMMTAKPLRKCPECKKLKLKRLIGTGAAVIFKGSGFYETDYRSKNYQEAAESDKKAAEAKPEKSESKSETKTESKSETKSETKTSDTGKSADKKAAPTKSDSDKKPKKS